MPENLARWLEIKVALTLAFPLPERWLTKEKKAEMMAAEREAKAVAMRKFMDDDQPEPDSEWSA